MLEFLFNINYKLKLKSIKLDFLVYLASLQSWHAIGLQLKLQFKVEVMQMPVYLAGYLHLRWIWLDMK